jgi:hypothetical protein
LQNEACPGIVSRDEITGPAVLKVVNLLFADQYSEPGEQELNASAGIKKGEDTSRLYTLGCTQLTKRRVWFSPLLNHEVFPRNDLPDPLLGPIGCQFLTSYLDSFGPSIEKTMPSPFPPHEAFAI